MSVYIFILNYISKCWYKNGKLHRNNDLPAVECYKNGKLLTIKYAHGTKKWSK